MICVAEHLGERRSLDVIGSAALCTSAEAAFGLGAGSRECINLLAAFLIAFWFELQEQSWFWSRWKSRLKQ